MTIEVRRSGGRAISSTDVEQPKPARLYRRANGRLVAGVAGGLADHLGLNPVAVRVAFVVLTVFNGMGALLYAAFWAVVPQSPRLQQPSPRERSELAGQLIAFGAIAAGLLVAVQQFGVGRRTALAVPLAVVVVGGALIWTQADEVQRAKWQRLVDRGASRPRLVALRIGVGAVLVVVGLISVLAAAGQLAVIRDALVATGVILAGIAIVTGPWWWRTWNDLAAERRERIRSQERAELAAHVHDSVLHTLALIQRHVDDPREVTRLARGQERELRAWLYRPSGSPDERFSAAVEAAAAEVEDTYAVSVDPVIVGDCVVDDRIAALVQATREALINAAKHAGVAEVSLYAEVEPDEVTVFVRDRGKGFDPDAVAADRHGIDGSITGRMRRHGGTAQVRSAPGEGTEVRLNLSRVATRRGPA